MRSRPARAVRAASQAPTPPDGAWSACARIAACATERSRPIGRVALQPGRTCQQMTCPRPPLPCPSPRCKRGFHGVARPRVAASSEMTSRHMRRRRRALGAGRQVRGEPGRSAARSAAPSNPLSSRQTDSRPPTGRHDRPRQQGPGRRQGSRLAAGHVLSGCGLTPGRWPRKLHVKVRRNTPVVAAHPDGTAPASGRNTSGRPRRSERRL